MRKIEVFYPSDYFRSTINKELNGNGENKYPIFSSPLNQEKPKKYFMKCEMPFFLVVNPNGHKCFISDDPTIARNEAWRLNNGK